MEIDVINYTAEQMATLSNEQLLEVRKAQETKDKMTEKLAKLKALAENGVGIVILSSEAQEIIRLCDRTVVMYHGKEQGVLEGSEMTESNIMILATGGDKSMIAGAKTTEGADK